MGAMDENRKNDVGMEWNNKAALEAYRSILERMEGEALCQLLSYGKKSKKQAAKDRLKQAAGRYVPPKDQIFWPTGMLANALFDCAFREGQTEERQGEILESLSRYFGRWMAKGMPIYYVDDALCGMALLGLYEKTKEGCYRQGADRLADYLCGLGQEAADKAGSIPYRPAQANQHIYVDAIGMICPFLTAYGERFQRKEAVELAVLQLKNMLAYGMDGTTGLPYHGFRYEDRVKYGIIGWGRAVGWLFMGLSGTLRHLGPAHTAYAELREAFQRLIEAVLPWQKENGAFSWQLQALDGPQDSSATAMIASSLCPVLAVSASISGTQAQNNGPDETIGLGIKIEMQKKARQLMEKAAAYIISCEKGGKIGQASGECEGFSQYPQIYGAYPWSLGPGLALLAAYHL